MPQLLPIHAFLDDIQQTLAQQASLVLQAEPGAGKSTVVPLALLSAAWLEGKKIIMLEPRRVAAKSIAHYLARQLGEKVGERVGYHVKNDRKIGTNTQLEIVTEGMLTRRLQADSEISDIGLIIFDEFHERSLQADLGLMLALEVQQVLRDDLRLLVMSATIDTPFIAAYLGPGDKSTAVIECPGRVFPVTVSYLDGKFYHLSEHVLSALQQILVDADQGDVLVFLPGQADISRCLEGAKSTWGDRADVVFLPLFGSLTMAQQEQAIQPDAQGRRRVVFTTNIAETSLTIEGVSWVIDSGLEKRIQYDPASGMTRLETVSISKASAEQRKGRAGRLQVGQCVRLWSETKQAGLISFQPEEILTAELASLVLELCAWGQTDYANTPWLTMPPLGHYQTAVDLLQSLGLLEGSEGGEGKDGSGNESNTLTTLGQQAVRLAIHPRLAAMLLRCENAIEHTIARDVAALLTEQDIFSRRGRGQDSVDISERFMALQDFKADKKAALKSYGLKRNTVEQVLSLAASLFKTVAKTAAKTEAKTATKEASTSAAKLSLSDWQVKLPEVLLRAYPDRLAKQRGATNRYIMANGKGVFLAEEDALLGNEWLIISDCDAQKREGRIYFACAIDKTSVFEILSEQFTEIRHYKMDAKKQKVIGREKVSFGAITVSETALSDIPTKAFQDCLIDLLKTEGLTLLNWPPRCEQWLARVQWLAAYNDSFPRLSQQLLQDHAADWLLPYLSHISTLAALKKQNIYDLLTANLSWEQQQELEAQAPVSYTSPSGQTVAINYDKNQGPTVSIVLQEMFGQLDSPSLAYGKVPLRFELLSPARRPIQTTSDLANFWVSSYFEVAKDMRAKYPRHRWPEEPLLAEAGGSRKPRTRR